jgi:uncharacterized protein
VCVGHERRERVLVDHRGEPITPVAEPAHEPLADLAQGLLRILVLHRVSMIAPLYASARVPLLHQLFVFLAACVAGAINAVAGGGTLVTFPTLVWLGVPAVNANMTNTVSLWPGSLGGFWGYRRELRDVDRGVYGLLVPSIAGGLVGAMLLDITPTDVFDRLVPILILFATVLFMLQDVIQRRFNLAPTEERQLRWFSGTMAFQLAVSVYGGYFGAGQGILMLATLTMMGHTDIHRMNGVKSLLATGINGAAAIYFAFSGKVVWDDAAIMAVGSVVGGIAGAGVARRVGRVAVRRIVVVIGFVAAIAAML